MHVATKRKGTAFSMPGGLAYGALISTLVLLSFCAITAHMVLKGVVAEGNIGYCVLVILLVSSFLGAISAYRKIKRQRMLVCLLSGLIYLLILLSATALLFGGQYEAVGVTSLLVLGGALTGGFIGIKEKRVGKYRKIGA